MDDSVIWSVPHFGQGFIYRILQKKYKYNMQNYVFISNRCYGSSSMESAMFLTVAQNEQTKHSL